MATRIIIVMICWMTPVWGFAQGYFNKVIPFEFGNPSVAGLYEFQDKFMLPVIYPGEETTLIVTDIENYYYYHYSYFDFSRSPLTFINNEIFLFAKDRSQSKALQIAKLDYDYDFEWVNEINTVGDSNFPTNSKSLNEKIYNSFLIEDNEIKKIGINQSDIEGNTVWTKYYESNIGYSYPWTLLPTKDDQMLLSYAIRYANESSVYPRVMKIDEEGDEIWKSSFFEPINGGADPIWLAQLSDSSIVQSYRINRFLDPVFQLNEWHFWPIRLLWLDNDGNQIREKLILSPEIKEISFKGIKAGEGDYFFAYGGYDELEDNMGIITKFSNQGDTLWAHRYEHSDYADLNIKHRVYDIIEMDNGDIIGMGEITPAGSTTKIWLFRVNAEGCFSSAACEEIVSTTNEVPKADIATLLVYPNPVEAVLQIELIGSRLDVVKIFDLNGRLILEQKKEGSRLQLDVANLVNGIYVLQISDVDGALYTDKFVKE